MLEQEIAKLLAEAFIKEFDNMIVNGIRIWTADRNSE